MSAMTDKLADQLALDVLKHIERTGDEEVVAVMSRALGDSSQTLQEAFVTSLRVQRAALRGRRLLAERAEAMGEGRPHRPQ